jgi:hypothetical protein
MAHAKPSSGPVLVAQPSEDSSQQRPRQPADDGVYLLLGQRGVAK